MCTRSNYGENPVLPSFILKRFWHKLFYSFLVRFKIIFHIHRFSSFLHIQSLYTKALASLTGKLPQCYWRPTGWCHRTNVTTVKCSHPSSSLPLTPCQSLMWWVTDMFLPEMYTLLVVFTIIIHHNWGETLSDIVNYVENNCFQASNCHNYRAFKHSHLSFSCSLPLF